MSDPVRRDEPNGGPPTLLRGGEVLTLDAEFRVLASTDVLLECGKISAVGRGLEPPPDARIVEAAGCFVLPGLVQGHVHLGQTFFRGLAEGRRLLPWLRERIWPLEAAHDDESAHWCSLLGAAECLLSGTTTIQEIGLGPGADGLMTAVRESRLRAQAGMCLMDGGEGMPRALCDDTDRVLDRTVDLGRRFHGANGGRLSYVLNPRFILSCSDPLWAGIESISTDRGWPIHTHALEQREETEVVRSLKQGRDEIEYFDQMGILAGDLRIAHGVWLTDDHLTRLRSRRFSVVHCPSANLKLGSGIADIVRIREAGIAVGIGSDGAPCNNELDAFKELRLAALLQHLKHGPGRFCGREAVRLATSEGAKALGLDGITGSIEVGKAADILIIDRHRPEFLAAEEVDPHDLIAFGGSRASVRHVFVAGEHLVADGSLTRLDWAEIRLRAEESLRQLLQRARI